MSTPKYLASRKIKCNDELLQKAEPYLVASKVSKLLPVVNDIKNIKGYDKDPNCLYIVTISYINISDVSNARNYLDKLNGAISSSNPINPSLIKESKLTLKNLDKIVSSMEKHPIVVTGSGLK